MNENTEDVQLDFLNIQLYAIYKKKSTSNIMTNKLKVKECKKIYPKKLR